MTALEFHQFPCLSDNYGVLVHNRQTGATLLIDAPDEAAIRAALRETGWRVSHILITHHHWDHTQAVAAIKSDFGCRVVGPVAESDKIADLDETIDDGDRRDFGGIDVEAIATPGHTLGQISYYLPQAGAAFTGDTLFALGCGRVFEGTPSMMWATMEKLMARLPDATRIYCGHEYTLANAKFAVTVDPDNDALRARLDDVKRLRDAGRPTLPTTMALEKQTNPFLRAANPALRAHLGMRNAENAAVFAEVRKRKDSF